MTTKGNGGWHYDIEDSRQVLSAALITRDHKIYLLKYLFLVTPTGLQTHRSEDNSYFHNSVTQDLVYNRYAVKMY